MISIIMLSRIASNSLKMRHVRFFCNQPETTNQKPKFSLHRMNILPFIANAGIGGSCVIAAYYNTKSIPYISGFLWALGGAGTGKIVPSFLILSATTGLAQI